MFGTYQNVSGFTQIKRSICIIISVEWTFKARIPNSSYSSYTTFLGNLFQYMNTLIVNILFPYVKIEFPCSAYAQNKAQTYIVSFVSHAENLQSVLGEYLI